MIEKLQEAWFKKEDTMQMIVKEHQDELQNAKSEVAMEIFKGIDKFFKLYDIDENYSFDNLIDDVSELKNKYTEESGNDR